VASLTDEVRQARAHAAELRLRSQRLRQRNRESVRAARLAVAAQRRRQEEWIVPSPWSTLPWRVPPRELDQVLVPLGGRPSAS